MKRALCWTVVLSGVAVAGCELSEPHPSVGSSRWSAFGSGASADPGYTRYTDEARAAADQPRLHLGERTVENALRGRSAELERRRRASVRSPLAASAPVERAAARVAECYGQGLRDLGDEVVRAHPDLYPWDEAERVVRIRSRYVASDGGGSIQLALERRPGVTGDLGVCVPPGSYGEAVADSGASGSPGGEARPWTSPDSERRFGDWPSAQDLAFLRAPVLSLPDGVDGAVAEIPVACASFDMGEPQDGQPYTLRSFPRGSRVDRLMVALCEGPPAAAPEAQMAVWMARGDLTWEEFVAEGGHYGRLATFADGRSVLPRHARGAAELLIEGGIDPRGSSFFRDGGDGEARWGEEDGSPPARPEAVTPPSGSEGDAGGLS